MRSSYKYGNDKDRSFQKQLPEFCALFPNDKDWNELICI